MLTDDWMRQYREAALGLARQEIAERERERLRKKAIEQLRRCEEFDKYFGESSKKYQAKLAELEELIKRSA